MSVPQSPGAAAEPDSLRAILSHPSVSAYLAARFFWMAALQINNVAVGWLVYDVTRSALALGFVGLAAFMPRLLLTLVSGLVADRYDRRRIIGVCLLVNAFASLGLFAVVLSPQPPMAAVYILFLVSGTARGFSTPAVHALAANLVRREQLSRVVGLGSSVSQTAAIAGPALGGFIYLAGAWAPFAVSALLLCVASALAFAIRVRTAERARGPVRISDVFAGLAFVRRQPILLGALSLDMFSVLLGGVTALLPIVASEILHVGPLGLGMLRAMPALGALTVGFTIATFPIRRHAGRKLFVAVTCFGLATIGFGLSRDIYVSMALLWCVGAADVFSVVIRQTLVQASTPDAMRGRVSAANSLFLGASNELGEFESGVTAALFGLVPAILIGGGGTVLIAMLWAVLFPALRRRDHLIDPGWSEPDQVERPTVASPSKTSA